MRCLDTPVLLDLLRGGRSARPFMRSLGTDEVATTELNLWELAVLARRERRSGRERRLATIEQLRRCLMVLPIDARATTAAVRLAAVPSAAELTPSSLLVVGAAQANGCSKWVTTEEVTRSRAIGPIEIERYRR